MGNAQRKRESAILHNQQLSEAEAAESVAKDLLPIGVCECGANLFMYLKSVDETMYNVYCDNPNDDEDESKHCTVVFDIRDPIENIRLFWSPNKIVEELATHYGADKVDSTFTQQVSQHVTRVAADSVNVNNNES